jgi:Zn-dependent peptidase ImmA (M78 family)/DNA-binding XRE family transcriptional regulator
MDGEQPMSTSFSDLNPAEIGERLRLAREAAHINQANAAVAINVARTTLVAIEKGERRVKIDELQKLASLYGSSVNGLLRQEAIHIDLQPRFRKLSKGSDARAGQAVKLMSDLAKAEVELENLLGVRRAANYPPERPILPGDVRVQAEQDATELRQWLGLGSSPIADIVTLLEMDVGARVYVRRIDSKISGVFAFDPALGPCILLNANHPRERRRQSAGHEIGHLVSTRRLPEILHLGETENSREERYANAFGRAFLAPSRAVVQKFQQVTAGADRLTRRHIILLSHFFGISREATVRRLEELRLTKPGTWDWFESNGKITDEQARQVLGDLIQPDDVKVEADRPTTIKINLLAAEAYRRGLLSEGQLARLLHLDRLELRGILGEYEIEGSDAHGAVELPR